MPGQNGRPDGWIPLCRYKAIHAAIPILCLDLVLVRAGRVLLVRRRQEPARGAWWVPGGRLMKGESFPEGARRISLSETGLRISRPVTIGVTNLSFREDPFGHGKGTHTVVVVLAAEARGGTVRLDANHSGNLWWDGKGAMALRSYVRTSARAGMAIFGYRTT